MTETEVAIGVVGAGRAGSAISRRLAERGRPPRLIASRTLAHASALAAELGSLAVPSPVEVLHGSEITLLTVPDHALAPLVRSMARELAGGTGSLKGRLVAHCAGAVGGEVLEPLADFGAITGVLHPVAAIPDGSPRSLDQTFAAIEAQGAARDSLFAVADWLGCEPFELAVADRVLYHAAAVLAGVMPVMLEGLAERVAAIAGAGETGQLALRPLLRTAAANVVRLGPRHGLSGPMVRADGATIDSHLAALEGIDPRLALAYRAVWVAAGPEPATNRRGDRGDD